MRALPKPPLSEFYPYSRAVYARQGELLRLTLAQDQQYRLWVPLQQIPEFMQQATLLYEDRWFFQHPGINLQALLRSAWMTYVRKGHQGGSTLSMQLARRLYNVNSRSVWGKLQQMVLATGLELRYSKAALLEAYLNTAPYGGNIVGVATASLLYFHKPVQQLTLAEALSLAVIPQNPKRRYPRSSNTVTTLPAALLEARARLWQQWLVRFPTAQRYAADFALPLQVYSRQDKPFLAPHVCNLLLQQDPNAPQIYSSIDLRTQLLIKQAIEHYQQQQRNAGVRNAAALLLDTHTLQVQALLGSANFWDRSIDGQVNGTLAKRSPGSTLKPFIYALAMQQGLVHPKSILVDTPATFGDYVPENFDNRFLGPLSVEDALIRSRNIPALTIAAQLKHPNLYEFLQRSEISGLQGAEHYGLALALGGAELSMVELAQLYASLANQGRWQPVNYQLTNDHQGQSKALLSPQSAFMTVDMLSHNPRPDTKRPAQPKVAWKTGTSWGYKDAWAIGLVGQYVLAVWVGNFDNSGHAEFVGIRSAAPLFFNIIDNLRAQRLLPGLETELTTPPDNLVQINVCTASGDLPNPACPQVTPTWFIPGKSPIKLSTLHQKVYFDRQTNVVVCPGSANAREEVFEFWPNDLATLFAEAGMPRRRPPPLPSCYQAAYASNLLEITSPSLSGSYVLRRSKPTTISLQANSKSNGQIFWFANKSFLGQAEASTSISWMPEQPGSYQIRALDSAGHAALREVQVEFIP